MKKIFTLLMSVVLVSSAFAQFNDRYDSKDKDYAYNDNKYKKDKDRGCHYYFSKKEMEMQIADINRNFERKIRSVKNNWLMPRFKKDRMIRELEDQRKDEIRDVYAKFRSPKNKFQDWDDKKRW